MTWYNTPERQVVLDTTVPTLEQDLVKLRDLQVQLAGIPSFFSNISLYHQSVEALEAANLNYSRAYQKIAGFLNLQGTRLPAELHTNDLEEIVSGIQILNTLLSRGNHLTTWVYIIVAFGCDILAAFAASTVFLEHERVYGGMEASDLAALDKHMVRYLWVPQTPPAGSYDHSNFD
jgi:hypothetical protein